MEKEYVEAMLERDEMLSVYMGNFIAIPHGTDEAKKYVKKSGICIVQVPDGVNFGTADEEKNRHRPFRHRGQRGRSPAIGPTKSPSFAVISITCRIGGCLR